MTSFAFATAMLPGGWADDVRVEVEHGVIRSVEAGASAMPGDVCEGVALPGMPNVHSHAFQRAMAGLAERGGKSEDSFWTWREVMYRFLERIGPEEAQAIAAYAYADMLEAGFTAVGEFHYLHRAPDGRAYDLPTELAERHVAAAGDAGIAVTMLPVFYAQSNFGGAPPSAGQRRFISDIGQFAEMLDHLGGVEGIAGLGVAPHSLRAVTPADLEALLALPRSGPVHIHAAEQRREVEDCVAWSGQRPVAWLFNHADIDERWCLIHATHLDVDETRALAASGAVAGLCPITEANLGDGIFPARDYLDQGGRFAVGSDSHIRLDAAEELRQLEYSQRLRDERRNVLAPPGGGSTGGRLLRAALAGGAQALGQAMGQIAPGMRADFLILDADHPDLYGRGGDGIADAWIFTCGRQRMSAVYAAGRRVVEGGRHVRRQAIDSAYRRAMAHLLD